MLLAYQGREGCTDVRCRRDMRIPDVCAGWHCGNCDQPSSQQGHHFKGKWTCDRQPSMKLADYFPMHEGA